MRSVRIAMLAAILLIPTTAQAALATEISLTAECTVYTESRAFVTGNVGEGVVGSFTLEVLYGGQQVAPYAYIVGNEFEVLSYPHLVVPPLSRLNLILRDTTTGVLLAVGVVDCADATPPSITATCTVLDSGRALVSGTVTDLFPEQGNIGVHDFSIPTDPLDSTSSNQVGFLYPVNNGDYSLTTFDGYAATAGRTLDVGLGRGGDFHGVAFTTAVCVSLIRSVTELTNDLVASGTLTQREGNSLLVKIDNSTASATKGNVMAAVNQLEAFKNEIQALYQSGRISLAERDAIVAAADRQIAALQAA